jgi:hypothetical protein
MALTIPYSFTNATIAEAGEVNSNNTAIKNHLLMRYKQAPTLLLVL